MLVNSRELLLKALKEGYAIPSYNINNIEWTKCILEACNEDNSPVILSVTLGAVKYFGGYNVVSSVVNSLIKDLNIKIPVVLHLDHGKTFLDCKEAIDAGFTSVMIDASSKTLEENIKLSHDVTEYAIKKNVCVEGEIGEFSNSLDNKSFDEYNCKEYVLSSGIDSLAPFIGNYHGLYKDEAKLDFELLGRICKEVKIPLVLHGASGLDDNKIKTCIFCGVSKININTELQVAWSNKVRGYLEYNKDIYDPRQIILSGCGAIKKIVHEKNNLFGSKNRAN